MELKLKDHKELSELKELGTNLLNQMKEIPSFTDIKLLHFIQCYNPTYFKNYPEAEGWDFAKLKQEYKAYVNLMDTYIDAVFASYGYDSEKLYQELKNNIFELPDVAIKTLLLNAGKIDVIIESEIAFNILHNQEAV